jgi:hypothetical protein
MAAVRAGGQALQDPLRHLAHIGHGLYGSPG